MNLRVLVSSLLFLLVLFFLLAAYQLRETEQVVITRLGAPVRQPVTEAGLHFRWPFLEQVNRLEKRIQVWDGDPEQVVTHDKKYIYFDTMARWRIDDPLLFLRRVRHEAAALARLKAIIDGAVRDAVSSHPLIEVVRTTDREMLVDVSEQTADEQATARQRVDVDVGREGLAAQILVEARANAKELGIDLIDVRVKRVNYVERVLQDVYERMITERERIAARYLSEGEGERSRILGQLERELKTITSEAFRKAEEIRGAADAEAARIYAEAYARDPDFYTFVKTLETWRTGLADGQVTLVLSSQSELFRMLHALPDAGPGAPGSDGG